MKTVLALAAAGLAATACIIVDADTETVAYDVDRAGERLLAASVDDATVVIRAKSNGCTNAESFDPVVERRGDNRFDVKFVRTREDYCRALLPEGVELRYARADLGLPHDATITIENAIGQ